MLGLAFERVGRVLLWKRKGRLRLDVLVARLHVAVERGDQSLGLREMRDAIGLVGVWWMEANRGPGFISGQSEEGDRTARGLRMAASEAEKSQVRRRCRKRGAASSGA